MHRKNIEACNVRTKPTTQQYVEDFMLRFCVWEKSANK